MSRPSHTTACFATAARKASRRLTALYDDVLAPVSLRSTQYAVLQELAAGTALSLGELAGALVLDRSSLGHSLRPLERDGLVALERSPQDQRSVLITMTAEGRRRYAKATALWLGAQQQVEAALGEPAADRLRKKWNDLAADDRLLAPPSR